MILLLRMGACHVIQMTVMINLSSAPSGNIHVATFLTVTNSAMLSLRLLMMMVSFSALSDEEFAWQLLMWVEINAVLSVA